MKRKFQNDGNIFFEKVFCPFCKCKTGDSNCDLMIQDPSSDGMDGINNIQLINSNGVPLPIYGPNCPFKINSLWRAKINYPVSDPLIKRLKIIDGLESITAMSKYTFQFAVGKMFDEALTKRELSQVFRAFIKEMQSKELGSKETNINKKKIIGVIMPNGKKSISKKCSIEQSVIYQNIINSIEGCKPIYDERE